jgi:death-on-curing protein
MSVNSRVSAVHRGARSRSSGSAVSRPINKWAYQASDPADLGAAYAFGIARNHPFVDGNKRMASLAAATFLRLNGVHFAPQQPAATAAVIALSAGALDKAGFARWIADNVPCG